jgi:hypothetical protein
MTQIQRALDVEGLPRSALEAAPHAELDEAVTQLTAAKAGWAMQTPAQCAALLDEVLRDVHLIGTRWVGACVAAKQLPPGGVGEGEEWLQFAIVLRLLRLLRRSLVDIANCGRPQLPHPLEQQANGRVTARVFPTDLWDRFSLPGIYGEVHMAPRQSPEGVLATQAEAYRRDGSQGSLTLVLAAGNSSALVPGDFLHQLFVERAVVLLKMNPVNAYLGPLIQEGFRALIREGVMAVIYGGAEVGEYLCRHPQVDAIHMTGSDRTFDNIVFGAGYEGAQRKADRTPQLTKRITAELGNITPVIVVPGPWTDQDVVAQANKLVSQFVINAAFNCLTPRLLVQSRTWSQRMPFLEAVEAILKTVPTRNAYYPGAQERHARFVTAHPQAHQIGEVDAGRLPWTTIADLPPDAPGEICFRSESFCSILAETTLDVTNSAEFLRSAVEFANDRLWGTLAAILVVHPSTAKEPRFAAALEDAVHDLRYGTVVINQPTVLAYMLGTTPWGSFPGQPDYDIQSGKGFVNNPLMFAAPVKSVVRGPFRQSADAFQPHHRHLAQFAGHFAAFQAQPSIRELSLAIWALMRT